MQRESWHSCLEFDAATWQVRPLFGEHDAVRAAACRDDVLHFSRARRRPGGMITYLKCTSRGEPLRALAYLR